MSEETIQIVGTSAGLEGGWLPVEGPHTRELREKLLSLGELPSPESFDRVRAEATRILSSCLPPATAADRRTGLVVGCIQSGKTMSITTVTALARDNDFRLVVVLAGTAKNLVQQTQERLEEHLGTEHWLVLPNPTAADANDLEACSREWRNPAIRPEQRRGVLCVVMKHKTHIDNVASLLRRLSLSGVNALVVDDEADQAGLNTRPDKGESPIYSAIQILRQALPRHTYLQYTATPQAPLLINLLDSLSPDFADTIEPGDGYVGGQDFFIGRPELVRDIPDDETGEDEGPPESLKECLRLFFLGTAATRLLGQNEPSWARERHRSMLVHPSRMVASHRDFAGQIERIKRDWTGLLSRSSDDDERKELMCEMAQSHAELARTFPQLPPLEDLTEHLTLEISRAKITIVNKDGSEVPWKRHSTHILVGGQKLDRGYTVKGLTVTHMARDTGAGNYDTIQQRARFFGYKRKYLGLCRVFLQSDVRDAFEQYVFHEKVLRGAIRRHRGRSLKTWNRVFQLAPGYRLTRANVHVEEYFRPSRGEWFKQQGPHLGQPDVIRDNNNTLEAFATSVGASLDAQWHRFGHHRGTTTLAEIQTLLDRLVPCGDRDFSSLLVAQEALGQLAQDNPAQTVVVYLMSWDDGQPRERTTRKDTSPPLVELHQGASSSDASGAYPGDAAVNAGEQVTLQVHRVRVATRESDTQTDVLGFALRLPSSFTSGGFVYQPKTVLVGT